MSDKSTEHLGVLADTLLSSTMKYYTSTTEFNCRSDLHAHQCTSASWTSRVKAGPHQRHTSSSWSALPSSSLTVCSAGTGWSMSVLPLIGLPVTSQSSRATITSPQESTTDNQGNFLRGRRRAANFFREIVFEISILTTERTGGLC